MDILKKVSKFSGILNKSKNEHLDFKENKLEDVESIDYIMKENEKYDCHAYNIRINNENELVWLIYYLDNNNFNGMGRNEFNNNTSEYLVKGQYKSFAHILDLNYPNEYTLYYIHNHEYIKYKSSYVDFVKNISDIEEYVKHIDNMKNEKYSNDYYKKIYNSVELSEKNILNKIEHNKNIKLELNNIILENHNEFLKQQKIDEEIFKRCKESNRQLKHGISQYEMNLEDTYSNFW